MNLILCLLKAHLEHSWSLFLLVGLIVRDTPVEKHDINVSVCLFIHSDKYSISQADFFWCLDVRHYVTTLFPSFPVKPLSQPYDVFRHMMISQIYEPNLHPVDKYCNALSLPALLHFKITHLTQSKLTICGICHICHQGSIIYFHFIHNLRNIGTAFLKLCLTLLGFLHGSNQF